MQSSSRITYRPIRCKLQIFTLYQCIILEINNCKPDSCLNGGKCINQPQLARFYCECPPSDNANEVIVGLRCENSETVVHSYT